MRKDDFLGDKQVSAFVDWMSARLSGNTFHHSYKNRRSGSEWRCNSLDDAYVQYRWPHPKIERLGIPAGDTFASNARALDALKKDLTAALANNSDAWVCDAAIDVMRWGGVGPGNIGWLLANKPGLGSLIRTTRDAFSTGETGHRLLNAPALRFNAGMTKVYSLICDDFSIYDSRVAAALGLAVVKFCLERGNLGKVPENLSFPWSRAKEAPDVPDPKHRNPSEAGLSFPHLRTATQHAQWNMRANWVLRAVLDRAGADTVFARIESRDVQLRALESALFMIGYDLPSLSAEPANRLAPDDTTPASTDWVDCQTLRRGNAFRYRVTAQGIKIENSLLFSDKEIASTLAHVLRWFKGDPFPLGNNAVEARLESAQPSLGKAYFAATRKNPPNSSRLAAVLEDLSILQRENALVLRGLHWQLNPDVAKRLEHGDGPISIRSILAERMTDDD